MACRQYLSFVACQVLHALLQLALSVVLFSDQVHSSNLELSETHVVVRSESAVTRAST